MNNHRMLAIDLGMLKSVTNIKDAKMLNTNTILLGWLRD